MIRNYLLLGPETGEKNDFIESIKAELPQEAEAYKFYPYDDYAEHLAQALGTGSLFCPDRFIWIEVPEERTASRTGGLKSDLEKLLCEYLGSPSQEVTLVISMHETRTGSALEAFFPNDNSKEGFFKKVFWEMKDSDKPAWIRGFFRKSGLRIDEDAISMILMLVDNDTSELKTVCSQIAMFISMNSGQSVTVGNVESFLSHTRQEDGYTLFAYMARGDLDASLRCVDTLLGTSSDQMAGVFSILVWSFRRLRSVLLQTEAGVEQYHAFQNARVLDKVSKISRPNDVATYRQACLNYTSKDAERIIDALSEQEIEFRAGGLELQRIRLHHLVCVIVDRKGRRADILEFPSF
ncbi:MAG: DNA polymerase III subunit delta [Sphaerochaetaceae bacterium]